MTQFLAITLALIIGSPNCWCCVFSPTPTPVKQECCKAGKDFPLEKSTSKKGKSGEPCPCDLSKTKREMSATTMVLPARTFTFATLFMEMAVFPVVSPAMCHRWLEDEGPPHDSRPIYARHCALRL